MPIPKSVDGLTDQELQDIEEENEEDMQIYSLKKRKWEKAWNNAEQTRRTVLEEREEKKMEWIERELRKLQEEKKKRKETEETKRREERKRKEQESESTERRGVQATKRMRVKVLIPMPERLGGRSKAMTTLDSDNYSNSGTAGNDDDSASESDNNNNNNEPGGNPGIILTPTRRHASAMSPIRYRMSSSSSLL
ncbi:hypothetical protein K435DRAFT_972454 [Dendrothele bispora CBS 962.96]|uniref:Uncharacterized protein n=1 Tax=Dendrothele bispora (strain CBS 962.96) TaxID=1314807 RepID=A0A4S8KYV3_DENBC|nr:hypothetical protein K435DRAFT_972454 [Dendrothele bispora CBS 962.96]